MDYLSRPPPNMNLIGEVCDSLGTDSLITFVGNHWATGGLRVNLTSVKGRIISDPLFAYTGLKCKLWQSVDGSARGRLLSEEWGRNERNVGNGESSRVFNWGMIITLWRECCEVRKSWHCEIEGRVLKCCRRVYVPLRILAMLCNFHWIGPLGRFSHKVAMC